MTQLTKRSLNGNSDSQVSKWRDSKSTMPFPNQRMAVGHFNGTIFLIGMYLFLVLLHSFICGNFREKVDMMLSMTKASKQS